MFPKPSNQKLSLFDIANYWAREIVPPCTPLELLIELAKAWWRGELTADGGPKRVQVLQALYASYSDLIEFYVAGTAEKPGEWELSDGGVEISLWCIPVPNLVPDSWTDTDCAAAFEALAAAWDTELNDLAPMIGGVTLSEKAFSKWISQHQDWQRPVFWASGQPSGAAGSKLTGPGAVQLASEYIQATNDAGRTPTQDGYEHWLSDNGVIGQRDLLRKAYKTVAGAKGIDVRRGRPKKKFAQFNSPQKCK
jgi:hypothetical protein